MNPWPLKEAALKIENLIASARNHLVTISDKAALTEAAARLGTDNAGLVVVCDDTGRMVGVVSKTDIVSRISACTGHTCTMMVASVMTRDVALCRPNDPLEMVWNVMKDKGHLHIPVVDKDNRPLGLLYARDVLQALLREVKHEEDLLREYVMGIGYR